ncbi:MAG: type II toxin-antitoxin system VapC family toxin [Desulfobacterales bacterium]
MITFVDTNILLDVFLPDPKWGNPSREMLEQAYDEGSLIINPIVYAELAPQFLEKKLLDTTLETLGIRLVPIDFDTAFLAGMNWKKYRDAGGKRSRILSDFLIGSHAKKHADRLLTRDRGFYREYFNDLILF